MAKTNQQKAAEAKAKKAAEATSDKKEVKMTNYTCKYKGLKIIIRAKWSGKVDGVFTVKEGDDIHFVEGRYSTSDPVKIAILDAYAKKNSGDVVKLTEANKALNAKVKDAVKKVLQDELTPEKENAINDVVEKAEKKVADEAAETEEADEESKDE